MEADSESKENEGPSTSTDMLINLSGAEEVPFPEALKTTGEFDDPFGIFKNALSKDGGQYLHKPLLPSPQNAQKPTAIPARNEKICILDLSNSNIYCDAPVLASDPTPVTSIDQLQLPASNKAEAEQNQDIADIDSIAEALDKLNLNSRSGDGEVSVAVAGSEPSPKSPSKSRVLEEEVEVNAITNSEENMPLPLDQPGQIETVADEVTNDENDNADFNKEDHYLDMNRTEDQDAFMSAIDLEVSTLSLTAPAPPSNLKTRFPELMLESINQSMESEKKDGTFISAANNAEELSMMDQSLKAVEDSFAQREAVAEVVEHLTYTCSTIVDSTSPTNSIDFKGSANSTSTEDTSTSTVGVPDVSGSNLANAEGSTIAKNTEEANTTATIQDNDKMDASGHSISDKSSIDQQDKRCSSPPSAAVEKAALAIAELEELEVFNISASKSGLDISWTIPASEFSPTCKDSKRRKSFRRSSKEKSIEEETNELDIYKPTELVFPDWNPFADDPHYIPVMLRPPVATLESIRKMVEELFRSPVGSPSPKRKRKSIQHEKSEPTSASKGSPIKEKGVLRTPPRMATPKTVQRTANLTFDKVNSSSDKSTKSVSSPCFKTPVRATKDLPAAKKPSSCARLSFTSTSSNSSVESDSKKKLPLLMPGKAGKVGEKLPAAAGGGIPKPFNTKLKFDSKPAASASSRMQPMKATLSSDFAVKAKAEGATKDEVKTNNPRVCASAPVQRKFASPGPPIAASSPKARPSQNSSFSSEPLSIPLTPTRNRFSAVKSSGYGRPAAPPPNMNATKVLESPSKRVSAPNLERPILKSPVVDRRSEPQPQPARLLIESKPVDEMAKPAAASGSAGVRNKENIPRGLLNRFGFRK